MSSRTTVWSNPVDRRNLEFDVGLVGPEPRDTGVFLGAARQGVGGNLGVLRGVID